MNNLLKHLLPDHCAIWFFSPKGAATEQSQFLRNLASKNLRVFDRHMHSLSAGHRIARLFSVFFWPFTTLVRAAVVTFRLRKFPIGETVWDIFHRYFECVWFAYRWNIAPQAYYKFRLFLPENSRRIGFYLQDHEMAIILRMAIKQLPQDLVYVVNDKLAFFEFFSAKGVSVAPVLLYSINGQEEVWLGDMRNLASDVVLKVTDLAAGQGIEVLSMESDGLWIKDGMKLSQKDLIEYLRNKSKGTVAILQPRLENHNDIKPLCGHGLSTVRVMTTFDSANGATVVASAMRMPVGSARVDNIGSGGMAVPVEITTGVLIGPAVKKRIDMGWISLHPNSRAPIDGLKLPYWAEVCDLVCEAHNFLPELPCIGWDVAILNDGPTLIEGNMGWDCELIQLLGRFPLGELPITDLLARQLARPL